MFGKSRTLALAVATAGVIGFGAPMASAATTSYGPGDNGGLINLSHNQIPVQACGNDVGVGVACGGVPVDGLALVGSLLSPGNVNTSTANQDRSCGLGNNQDNTASLSGCATCGTGPASVPASDNGGLVNVSHNQVPVQACSNDAAVGVLGGAVTADSIAGALGILSPNAVGTSTTNTDRSCGLGNNQMG